MEQLDSEDWREYRAGKKRRRQEQRPFMHSAARERLQQAGLSWEEKNDGEHLIVRRRTVDTRSIGVTELWQVHLDGGKGTRLTSLDQHPHARRLRLPHGKWQLGAPLGGYLRDLQCRRRRRMAGNAGLGWKCDLGI